jgi:hypothetical protein
MNAINYLLDDYIHLHHLMLFYFFSSVGLTLLHAKVASSEVRKLRDRLDKFEKKERKE